MIRTLELRYFSRHEDLKVDFAAGLNVLRGPNEVGKTTVIEGVLYALYGAKALRDTLAETVTWGHKESELKVKLVIDIGRPYTFTRSKAGAECNYTTVAENGSVTDVRVTGQNEVTAFSASLLGADAKTAALLMLASQSGLRGALDDGPGAVSSLMGKLADFDMIDAIIEAATKKLSLGSAVPIQTKLAEVEVDIVNARAVLDVEDRAPAMTAVIVEKLAALAVTESLIADVLQPAITTTDDAVQAAKSLEQDRINADLAVDQVQRKLATEMQRLEAATVQAARIPDAAVIDALRSQLLDVAALQREVDAYATFGALPEYPAEFWTGTKEDFDTEHSAARSAVATLSTKIDSMRASVSNLKRSLITSGKCPTCGSTKNSDEHVAQHNASIATEILEVELESTAIAPRLVEARDNVASFDRVVASARPFETAAAKLDAWVAIENAMYPLKLTWRGPAPTTSTDSKALRGKLQALEAEGVAASQAEGRRAAHSAAAADLGSELAKAREKLAAIVVPEMGALVDAFDLAYRAYADANTVVRDGKAELTTLVTERDESVRQRLDAEQRLAALQARVAEYQADMRALEFNNNLVAKLKKLKPLITDHLWNTVLAAVSNFFSTLRGEQSVVTKDADGFKVNGKSVKGLSGSTLDVLALSIRVALSKTFIPHASFMVLDEPAHGCDPTRTGNVLGFLSSVGFQQTVLASHDELSEAVADNVILLGE